MPRVFMKLRPAPSLVINYTGTCVCGELVHGASGGMIVVCTVYILQYIALYTMIMYMNYTQRCQGTRWPCDHLTSIATVLRS